MFFQGHVKSIFIAWLIFISLNFNNIIILLNLLLVFFNDQRRYVLEDY